MKALHALALASICAVLVPALAQADAPEVDFLVISKRHAYEQTGWGTVQDAALPWQFRSNIDASGQTASFPEPPNQITDPNGGVHTLIFNSSEDQWHFAQDFLTQTALNTAFPNAQSPGTPYIFSVGNGSLVRNLYIHDDLYPNYPDAMVFDSLNNLVGTWASGNSTLLIHEAQINQPLTILTNVWTANYTASAAHADLTIFGTSGNLSINNEQFGVDQLALNLTAGQLESGLSYEVEINFDTIIDFEEVGNTTSASTYQARTTFQIYVIPESSTTAMMLGAGVLTGAMFWRRRKLAR